MPRSNPPLLANNEQPAPRFGTTTCSTFHFTPPLDWPWRPVPGFNAGARSVAATQLHHRFSIHRTRCLPDALFDPVPSFSYHPQPFAGLSPRPADMVWGTSNEPSLQAIPSSAERHRPGIRAKSPLLSYHPTGGSATGTAAAAIASVGLFGVSIPAYRV